MESPQAKADKLKVIFLPFLSTSHIIPLVEIARLFAMHVIDVTIITTSAAAVIFQNSTERHYNRGRSIKTHVIKFPSSQVGLPVGIETFNFNTPQETIGKIYQGLSILKEEFERLFEDLKADCTVTDMFYFWTADSAAKLGIPRLIFLGGSYLARSALNSIKHFAPHKDVESNIEKFTLTGLLHQLEMTRLQLPDWVRIPSEYTYLMVLIRDAEKRSFGSLFDSFYELEGTYQEHYKRVMGTKSWSLEPVSLWVNQDASDKAERRHAKAEREEE